MVLIKVRLNVLYRDLAFRFGVSVVTVSRTFLSWMTILDVRLSPLIGQNERNYGKLCSNALSFLLERGQQ